MGDMLKPRYEYDNETSVLPEGDSQNDILPEALMQGTRDRLWATYNASKVDESVAAAKAEAISRASYYAEARAKVKDVMNKNSPEVRYADWNVAEDDVDNYADPLDDFALPSGGGAHKRITVKKNGYIFGKGGVKIKPHSISSVLLEKERREARIEARRLRQALRATLSSKK